MLFGEKYLANGDKAKRKITTLTSFWFLCFDIQQHTSNLLRIKKITWYASRGLFLLVNFSVKLTQCRLARRGPLQSCFSPGWVLSGTEEGVAEACEQPWAPQE